jgi:hypothetical protein
MKLNYLFLLVTISFSCNSHQTDLYEIDPRNFIDNKITLAEIADDINYTPLDNSIPLGKIRRLRIANNYIYLSTMDAGIMQFDRNGKFIRKIGNRGRGPEEYLYDQYFAVDEFTGNIFVLDLNKLKVYSRTGIFLRDFTYKDPISWVAGDIEIYNSFLFFPDYIRKGNSKFNWIFLDTVGNLVSKKENFVPPFQTNATIDGCIYRFENKLFYFNIFNDTIFSISPDLTSAGEYLFAQWDHRWPKKRIEAIRFPETGPSWFYSVFQPLSMFETKRFIWLFYSYREKSPICLIDKKTKKIFLAYKYDKTIENREYSSPYLLNNLDGGMPCTNSINYYTENNEEYITTLINVFDLKVYISSDGFKNIIAKYPEKKKELEKLANSLKETDNPILMLVRLKK